MDQLRVVVADDQPMERRRLARLLEGCRCQVVAECLDGDDVLRAVKRHMPDAVFTDVDMPGTNGVEILHAVGDLQPVVLITGHRLDAAAEVWGVDEAQFIRKPINLESIAKAVERIRPAGREAQFVGRRVLGGGWTQISWARVSRLTLIGTRVQARSEGVEYETKFRSLSEAREAATVGDWDYASRSEMIRLDLVEEVARDGADYDALLESGGHVLLKRPETRRRLLDILRLPKWLRR